MIGDLHSHTTFSDGSVKVKDLTVMARALQLDALAISDHDSIQSVRYAYENPIADGVQLIPALEVSTYDETRREKVHILLYYPDDCAALAAHSQMMQDRRNTAYLASAQIIETIYPQFKTAFAQAYAADSGTLYKSSIMQVLQQAGLADNMYGDCYQHLFGKQGLAKQKMPKTPIAQALALVRACRGVAVLAHPSVYHSMPLLRELCKEGLIDGVEIDHPRNTEADKLECHALAEQYGLIVTGGSDFHGANAKRPHPLATHVTVESQILRIQELAQKRKCGG